MGQRSQQHFPPPGRFLQIGDFLLHRFRHVVKGTGQVAHLVLGVYLGAQGIIAPCDLFRNLSQLVQRIQRFPQDQRQQNTTQQQAPQQGKLRHAGQFVDVPIGFFDVCRAIDGQGRLQHVHVLRGDQQVRPVFFDDAASG